MSSSALASKLDRLRDLGDSPEKQAEYAERLFRTDKNPDVVRAALDVLARREDRRLRPVPLAKYAYCDQNGVRRDPGGTLRAAIIHALRPLVVPEDTRLLERAATTVEFLFGEAAGDLRAAGLLVLNEVDHTLAGYHAVRLLTDEHTSIMSGEPALTAVRVLASQGQTLPLYAYAMRDGPMVGDVLGESLRNLTTLPASLLPAVVARHGESEDEIALLGLFDLLLEHPAGGESAAFIVEFLRTTTLYNIYRYMVSTLLTSRDEAMLRELRALADLERNPRKREILRDALGLRSSTAPKD